MDLFCAILLPWPKQFFSLAFIVPTVTQSIVYGHLDIGVVSDPPNKK